MVKRKKKDPVSVLLCGVKTAVVIWELEIQELW